ncbi:hypothetical protein LTR08_009196 [Meristemomyces frigidus]|nr:hypothetical protein LTR08_009196 [Meristemomyces frigidus]
MADQRFSALNNDPRYRLPNRKDARTAIDPRFGRLLTDGDFRKKASVDRYGRKVAADSGRKELERLYRLDKPVKAPVGKQVAREVVGSDEEEEEVEESEEEDSGADDEALVDPARNGGFSHSEEETEEEEDSDEEAGLLDETAGQEQTEDIPMGDVTRRIAAVNLDWDNIRASDILAVASSFTPASGRIEGVTIYPSEFGRERLQREELEGPPREIFASSKRTASSGDEDDSASNEEGSADEAADEKIKRQLLQQQTSEGQEFDTAALRQYQLERLRYYYAVIACDSHTTAKALYDSMDGREYLSTANFFDLRFIPDDTSFDDDPPRDQCEKLDEGYKPNEFRTEALTHSKVRLTWDDDDTTRKEVQKRAFSRAEIDENDLQAYIGSDSSDVDSISSRKSKSTAEERKLSKKEAQKMKARAALGLTTGEAGAGKTKAGKKEAAPVGDMQITFTSGLGGEAQGGKAKGVFENEPQDEESTRARYIRKERDRKVARKERMKASRHGGGADDDEPAAPTPINDPAAAAKEEIVVVASADEDAGFDDPFFADPASAAVAEKKARKAERLVKREARLAREEAAEGRKKELELLMAGDGEGEGGDGVRHFDMREIERAEKRARRKGGKKKKKGGEVVGGGAEGDGGDGGEEAFKVDAADPRFAGVFERHEFALDPTHPRFKGTEGMKTLLEEGRRKRKRKGGEGEGEDDGEETVPRPSKVKAGKKLAEEDLEGLVARIKGKGRGD